MKKDGYFLFRLSRYTTHGALMVLMAVAGLLWYFFPVAKDDLRANRLAGEISPYLLQHAYNPVDWYPWGPEALERARREDKPIFLSIGYSTCYWCHVMEREVFSDSSIAVSMNTHFVNIKVDREERPDLDEWFMTATQLLGGQGGWPNSVFLTPDLHPFYAGTYFPPTDRPGRPGFPGVLRGLSVSWQTRRAEVVAHADKVEGAMWALQDSVYASVETGTLDTSIVETAVRRLKERFDGQNEGFGGAPKFPPVSELTLLLAYVRKTGDTEALSVTVRTLDAMRDGALYDHVEGGFHRYTIDSRWRMPHFEKMLYTQADMAELYLRAYEITGRPDYRATAEETLAFVERRLRAETGVFYSAIDAETRGVEGGYYVWTERELREALGSDTTDFLNVFGLAPLIEGEGQALYRRPDEEDTTGIFDGTPERVSQALTRLREARSRRESSQIDTKTVLAWNARMTAVFAVAASVTGNSRYREIAVAAMTYLLGKMRRDDGTLLRVYRNGMAGREAFQEDYAHLIDAALRLYETTGERRWLAEAERLSERMIAVFRDEKRGGFFFTDGHEQGLPRVRYPYDGVQPSGNAVATRALMGLAKHTGRAVYEDHAVATLRAFADPMRKAPGRFTGMISAMIKWED
ncbi:MAG: thioredoxin domain-containing protein [candidate division Zixibacteria bacterium]|nr:thioredoxin domain-containing protein [candidate division Zixibacteria bacterium]